MRCVLRRTARDFAVAGKETSVYIMKTRATKPVAKSDRDERAERKIAPEVGVAEAARAPPETEMGDAALGVLGKDEEVWA